MSRKEESSNKVSSNEGVKQAPVQANDTVREMAEAQMTGPVFFIGEDLAGQGDEKAEEADESD